MPPAADRDLAVVTTLHSLSALLRHRAAVQPDDRAYVALSDRGQEEVIGDEIITLAITANRWRSVAIAHDHIRSGRVSKAYPVSGLPLPATP